MSLWETFLNHLILLNLVCLPALLWCVLLAINYFTCGVCKSKARLDGKTVILTGCTSGIGVTTALELARRGARLIMACRNMEKAKSVKEDIVKATRNDNVVVMQLDVSVLSSVRKFAAEVNKNEPRLDVLIHNAGLVDSKDRMTEDGIDRVWATNHFGPFLLNHLLLDLLKKTGKTRIIYVSSLLHYIGKVNLQNPNPGPMKEKMLGAFYNSSKFAVVLVAREFARRLDGSGVTVNSLHPGAIFTPICEQGPFYWKCLTFIAKPMMKTLEQGAQTTIHLAVAEEVEGVSGKFFSDCREFPPSKRTKDVNLARKYWTLCEQIVQLKPSDPHIE